MTTVRAKTTGKKKAGISQQRDRWQTPCYALDPLLPFLKPSWMIWEPALGNGNISRKLQQSGFRVIGSDILYGQNFFTWHPDKEWDALVTNPPFTIKAEWLARCYRLGKPFALLMPLDCLGAAGMQALFRDGGIEIVLFDKRIDYILEDGTVLGNVPFASAWYTWGMGIGKEITFASVAKYPCDQRPLFDEISPAYHQMEILL